MTALMAGYGKPLRHAAQSGYGLALIVIFFMAAVLTVVSLQMITSNSAVSYAKAAADNMSAYNMAVTGLSMIRRDISDRLVQGQVVDASYTYPSTPVSVPPDPTTLAGSTQIGYISGSVLKANGNSFLVKSNATVNGTAASVTSLMEIRGFSCAAVENAIAAGNISTLSDSTLIAYAQNNCMVKSMPSGIAPYVVEATTRADAPDCTSGWFWDTTGTGTSNIGSTTGTCNRHYSAYYDKILYGTISNTNDWWMNNVACLKPYCEVHVPLISSPTNVHAGIHAYDMNPSAWITNPVIFKVGTITGEGRVVMGDGGSTGSISVSSAGQLEGGQGADTFIVNKYTTDAGDANDAEVVGNKGADTFYVNVMTDVGGGNTRLRGAYWNDAADPDPLGDDIFYFNEINTTSAAIYNNVILGQSGNDTIICTGFSGGADATHVNWNPSRATCTGVIDGSEVKGGDGNDKIFIDGPATQAATSTKDQEINGEAGNNIVYVKSISNVSNRYSWVLGSTSTTGGSLIIIGGNLTHSGADHIWLESYGNNNVLLVKSGVTISGNVMVSNGPGTDISNSILYNGSQTSTANFPRILRY